MAGVGDPEHRGWSGRIAARSHRDRRPVTAYNLGIRRDTGDDVCRRLPAEIAARRAEGCDNRIVVSFGVNDTTLLDDVVRAEPARSVAGLLRVAEHAAAKAMPLLVVGPPPVVDAGQNDRIAALDRGFRDAALERGIPYAGVFDALLAGPVWMREVHVGDGSHPGAAGYALLADLVQPVWRAWIG